MILAAGLQSGGTTLISYCFLQRQDTDGVLDLCNKTLRVDFGAVTTPNLWVKMTVGAFGWPDLAGLYNDLGWGEPKPLLIVRDVRAAYNSLLDKYYGVDGTTGDDPPLRVRYRRFLRDWELFQERGWPIISYEEFVADPQSTLRGVLPQLDLDWDDAMITWSKGPEAIAYPIGGNDTFRLTREAGDLASTLANYRPQLRVDRISEADLEWLEGTFANYNRIHGYPTRIERSTRKGIAVQSKPPAFEGTERQGLYSERERLSEECERLRQTLAEIEQRLGQSESVRDQQARRIDQLVVEVGRLTHDLDVLSSLNLSRIWHIKRLGHLVAERIGLERRRSA